MAELRGGMIGCGFFAQNHMNGWQEVDGVKIVAVCDADIERARAFARRFGIDTGRAYHNAAQMLREKLDFVDIITQPDSHRALVELAAAYKTPVICQKPLAPTLVDAQAMIAACREAGVPFMVHENFRWQRPIRALKQAANEIGVPFFGRFMFRSGYDPSVNQPYLAEERRFILYDLGVHILDVARFFMGDALQLTCQIQRVNPRVKGEDVATVLLKMEGGATALVEVSYASRTTFDPFPQTLILLEGPLGRAELDQGYRIALDTGEKCIGFAPQIPIYRWSTPPFEAVQDSVVAIQRHWADSLRSGIEPETSGRDNLQTLELLFGAYASAEQGRTIQLPHPGDA
jgi:predicted dehydrogenase